MCTVFEELAKEHERKGKEEGREEGREKGREEGREEGRKEGKAAEIIEGGFEFGLSRENILERLQKKLNISLQKAQEYMQKYGKLLS